ncbi:MULTISPECIES: hypothetical protein [Elizabethkingia]|uniref:hypothetical protein n=1 Tax=Elizabethkingia TaxID=308865 RepID=UPI0021A68397|nr:MULTISPECIES: hypothetical protein [Elizabethkingia]MCT3689558.1 hypothetical protein [Elizabethkingia anophelis]MCT3706354.1 hypothetical protein [Elizabethkingia anophelis]MCT3713372.1 hypothetical protein [Elizabethkingia anophelis]MCT3716790.1 hypothetical protein [Elizabethkingia anophelis]MCT3730451.1 hypothetical protein [Elizabethkingia anophelis]
MKKFKHVSQNDQIEAFKDALETNSIGKQISEKYDIKYIPGTYSSSLIFTPKEDTEINPIDFLLLGYYVGRDY